MRLITIILALALAACGPRQWAHPYKTHNEFYADNAQCQVMAGNGGVAIPYAHQPSNPFTSGFANSYNSFVAVSAAKHRKNVYESCMMGAGWR